MVGQTPLGYNAVTKTGTLGPVLLGDDKALSVGTGIYSALALAAGQNVVKASAGRICTIIVTTIGTGGTYAVNDAATTGAVASSNLVWSGSDTLAVGSVIVLNFPCENGIVVTVPTSGTASVSFN